MEDLRVHMVLVFLGCFLYGTLASQPDLIVHTAQGSVRGTNLTSIRSNRTFFAFMGIPYAKSPVGELRFKTPQPIETWNGTKSAMTESPVCPQISRITNNYEGDEDCLYINVYSPKLPSENATVRNPVMVWIHGGDFMAGSSNRNMTGPDYLVDENVVVVSFNYRIGILGFLSLQNRDVPGNNGLKDQVLALKWVKQNINSFGGDPNKITIFGQGSGATCVHYHLLSPMSQGLFQQAISQSGTPLNKWIVLTNSTNLGVAFTLGKMFENNENDTAELLQTFKNASAEELTKYLNKVVEQAISDHLMGPTLDTSAFDGDVFLPDSPLKLTKEGKVLNIPYMIGMNNAEGLKEMKAMTRLAWLMDPVEDFLVKALPYYTEEIIPDVHDMALEIKDKYFNNTEPLLLQYADVVTDHHYATPLYCIAKKLSNMQNSSIFAYLFSFDGNGNAYKKVYGSAEYKGACHGDELPYLFRMDALNVTIEPNTTEFLLSSRLVKLWTNFAKTGNPTPNTELPQNVTWSPISGSYFPYMNIDSDMTLKNDNFRDRPAWWEELYHKYIPDITLCWQNY